MIVEIIPFDLVDGNRFVPGDRAGLCYVEALEQLLPLISVSLHLGRWPYPLPGKRAVITVHLGTRSDRGIAATIEAARALFIAKDTVEGIINRVDPPLDEWQPYHSTTGEHPS